MPDGRLSEFCERERDVLDSSFLEGRRTGDGS